MNDLFQTSGTSPTGRTKIEPDFVVEDHGSIFLLRALTPAANSWIEENLSEDRMTFCSAVVIESRYVVDILEGIAADGFSVTR